MLMQTQNRCPSLVSLANDKAFSKNPWMCVGGGGGGGKDAIFLAAAKALYCIPGLSETDI